MDELLNQLAVGVALQSPFPASTKQSSGQVADVKTETMLVSFADKILITICQGGRLAQWLQVPLDVGEIISLTDQQLDQDDDSMLPLPYLTPRTLLGGADPDREALGQLYASQIASAILKRNPDERRTVLLGLGFESASHDRQAFIEVLGLVEACL